MVLPLLIVEKSTGGGSGGVVGLEKLRLKVKNPAKLRLKVKINPKLGLKRKSYDLTNKALVSYQLLSSLAMIRFITSYMYPIFTF